MLKEGSILHKSDGQYSEQGVYPSNGMSIARQLGTSTLLRDLLKTGLVHTPLGMITYRTREEFNQRFGWHARGPYHLGNSINFEVENYLQNAGT